MRLVDMRHNPKVSFNWHMLHIFVHAWECKFLLSALLDWRIELGTYMYVLHLSIMVLSGNMITFGTSSERSKRNVQMQ